MFGLGPPIRTELNNGIQTGMKAMPQKDITSDGNSSFAIARHNFIKSLPATTPTVSIKLEKKWYGNRDASQVTSNRKMNEVGNGSLNASAGDMSFKNIIDKNTARQALARARSGGAVAPLKKIHKYTNPPIF